MTKVCGTDHTHNSLLSFFGSIHKQNSLRPCYNKNINLATSISGNTPNLCPFAKRTNMKNRNGQRLSREITQLSSKWRLQSKCVFPPKWVAYNWARVRYFCDCHSWRWGVCFKWHQKERGCGAMWSDNNQQDIITQPDLCDWNGLYGVRLLMCGDWQTGETFLFQSQLGTNWMMRLRYPPI